LARAQHRYGLRGFYERDAKPVTLTRSLVDGVHLKGGTMLVRACGVWGVGCGHTGRGGHGVGEWRAGYARCAAMLPGCVFCSMPEVCAWDAPGALCRP